MNINRELGMDKVHKRVPGLEAPCGAQYVNIIRLKRRGARTKYLPTSYYWKAVTCKNCLKHRPKRSRGQR